MVFGNQGWLYMRAMTWWDHETRSIWSQPIGQALVGPLRGTTLQVLPSALVPWGTWRAEHPNTLVLAERAGLFAFPERPRDDFVIGIALGDHSKAYRYTDASRLRVINDRVGPFPVLVVADPRARRIQTFSRATPRGALTFTLRDGALVDRETGTVWDPRRGLAQEGPLRGEALRVIPHSSAFDWAWLDFYPRSQIYVPPPSSGPSP